MKPLRQTIQAIVVTLGLTAALGLTFWARPAAADPDRDACPAAADADRGACPAVIHVSARPVHTDATARMATRRGHAARAHRHRHGGVRAGRISGTTTTRREPLSPPRQRPEHRAA
jgi:hypothetical protein